MTGKMRPETTQSHLQRCAEGDAAAFLLLRHRVAAPQLRPRLGVAEGVAGQAAGARDAVGCAGLAPGCCPRGLKVQCQLEGVEVCDQCAAAAMCNEQPARGSPAARSGCRCRRGCLPPLPCSQANTCVKFSKFVIHSAWRSPAVHSGCRCRRGWPPPPARPRAR